MKLRSWRELDVYQSARAVQDEIFELSKQWPKEETYSLIDQIRRSSRSIGANLAESWSKRRYPANFLLKLTDGDGELQETMHWLDTAQACGYLREEAYENLIEDAERTGRQLGTMMNRHETFCH